MQTSNVSGSRKAPSTMLPQTRHKIAEALLAAASELEDEEVDGDAISKETHTRVGKALKRAGLDADDSTWGNDAAPSWGLGLDEDTGEYAVRIFCGSWEGEDPTDIGLLFYKDGEFESDETVKDPDAAVALAKKHLKKLGLI